MTDYEPDLDEPAEATPEQLLSATLQLQVAVDQLTQPGMERLDRSRPEADTAVQAVDAEHQAHTQQLRAAHALALHRRDRVGMRRALARLIAHEQRAHARAVTQAVLPSLLEQLRDAVNGRTGTGNRAGSVYRAAIGFESAELLGYIERGAWHVGAVRGGDLAFQVRTWADGVVERQNATELPEAADLAEQWVMRARAILAPDRGFEIPEECPHCGNRWAHVLDDTGTRVRKSALQVSYGERMARCIHPACGSRWPETHWDHLKALLDQRRQEREDDQRRREAG